MTITDEEQEEALDVGMPFVPDGYCPAGFQPCSVHPERNVEVLVIHAWIDFDGDVRTGKPTRWFRYVSRWNGDWDEPSWMTDKPGASWFGDDEELADGPSFWQPLAALPSDLPVFENDDAMD